VPDPDVDRPVSTASNGASVVRRRENHRPKIAPGNHNVTAGTQIMMPNTNNNMTRNGRIRGIASLIGATNAMVSSRRIEVASVIHLSHPLFTNFGKSSVLTSLFRYRVSI
jgi:hypothetical protein